MDAMRELVLALAGAEKKSKRIFHKWWKVKDEAIRLREQIVQLATQIANDPGDEHQEPDLGGEGLKCEAKVFTIPREVQDEFGPEAKKFKERASAEIAKRGGHRVIGTVSGVRSIVNVYNSCDEPVTYTIGEKSFWLAPHEGRTIDLLNDNGDCVRESASPAEFTRYDTAGNVVEKTIIDGLGNKVTSKAFELKHGFLKQEADEETPAHIVGDDVSASQTDRWEDQEKVSNNTETLRDEIRNRLYGEFDDHKETPAHVAARSIANEVTKPADEPKRINFREFL